MKELKRIKKLLKSLDKKLVKSLKKVSDEDVLAMSKYLLISKLKEIQLTIEHEFSKKKKQLGRNHSGVDYLQHKISQIKAKINLFEIDFNEEEFKKLKDFLNKLKEEVRNV